MTFAQAQQLAGAIGRTNALALNAEATALDAVETALALVQAAPVVTAAASSAFSAERVLTTSAEITVDVATPGVVTLLVI